MYNSGEERTSACVNLVKKSFTLKLISSFLYITLRLLWIYLVAIVDYIIFTNQSAKNGVK